MTSIEDNTFLGCSSLISVTIPNSVTSIGKHALYGCSSLTSITIPNSVTSIGEFTFGNCTSLTNIDIPNSVTSIENTVFYNCTALTGITVAEGNSVYDSRNNCNAIIESASNKLIAGCQNTTIPNSVTSIENWAFYGHSGLNSIAIPSSIISIGNQAFTDTGIYLNATEGVFYVDKWVCGYKGTMRNNTSIVLAEGTRGISNYAFSNCLNMTSIVLPNSLKYIGEYGFNNCDGLTSIEIPNSVTSIRIGTFVKCI